MHQTFLRLQINLIPDLNLRGVIKCARSDAPKCTTWYVYTRARYNWGILQHTTYTFIIFIFYLSHHRFPTDNAYDNCESLPIRTRVTFISLLRPIQWRMKWNVYPFSRNNGSRNRPWSTSSGATMSVHGAFPESRRSVVENELAEHEIASTVFTTRTWNWIFGKWKFEWSCRCKHVKQLTIVEGPYIIRLPDYPTRTTTYRSKLVHG